MSAEVEMPRYRCHKEVYALKIARIYYDDVINDCGALITPEDNRYGPFEVDEEYISKHKPQVGGYFVVYDDNYKSFSPAKAFEEGYTRIA